MQNSKKTTLSDIHAAEISVPWIFLGQTYPAPGYVCRKNIQGMWPGLGYSCGRHTQRLDMSAPRISRRWISHGVEYRGVGYSWDKNIQALDIPGAEISWPWIFLGQTYPAPGYACAKNIQALDIPRGRISDAGYSWGKNIQASFFFIGHVPE